MVKFALRSAESDLNKWFLERTRIALLSERSTAETRKKQISDDAEESELHEIFEQSSMQWRVLRSRLDARTRSPIVIWSSASLSPKMTIFRTTNNVDSEQFLCDFSGVRAQPSNDYLGWVLITSSSDADQKELILVIMIRSHNESLFWINFHALISHITVTSCYYDNQQFPPFQKVKPHHTYWIWNFSIFQFSEMWLWQIEIIAFFRFEFPEFFRFGMLWLDTISI